MPRDMLCYCLNLTYDDIRSMWEKGYFTRQTDHQPGMYCTSCKGDLAWFLERLAGDTEAASIPSGARTSDGPTSNSKAGQG